jgi:transcriptional regulator with XRE-family HTH domain
MGKTFADQLRQAIDNSKLSRYAICKQIDIPASLLSRFMNGKGGLSVETINKLCALLHVRLTANKPRTRKKG